MSVWWVETCLKSMTQKGGKKNKGQRLQAGSGECGGWQDVQLAPSLPVQAGCRGRGLLATPPGRRCRGC